MRIDDRPAGGGTLADGGEAVVDLPVPAGAATCEVAVLTARP